MCGKGEVHVEGDMVDEGAYAAVVEVHGVYVSNSNTANTVYDDVVFVASVGTDGEIAGGRGGVVVFGRFVESDFLYPDEIADVEAGDEFF
jgi:hypothetical protein